jgi:hypothetical protein
MMYQVGRANSPQSDDPTFGDDLAAAMAYARAWSEGNTVLAVWKWDYLDYAETVCLVYQGDVYERRG